MADIHQFTQVSFKRFKALNNFTFKIRHFNILVGPNNAGKSTILMAFRILAAALRKANYRKPEIVVGPQGAAYGYPIELSTTSVAEENIYYNYDDSEPASVTFQLSNKNQLVLYFPEQGVCRLFAQTSGKPIMSPSAFRSNFNCPIGFVPILGPVDHHEGLYEKESARLALFNYKAARNFRNIWYHYPEKFETFRAAVVQTWPSMDIEPPTVDMTHSKARLHMFCPEDRIPREIFWVGFGFQVWCQMLTHIIQTSNVSIFLIDEPDIYLHSDLQRQLLGLLRNMGPDILIATHSTEIITEAETDDIVLINKNRSSARRIQNPSQLSEVFTILGSNLNPVLTQLAKTRRVLFVEGKDFQILAKFASKLGYSNVGTRSEFAVVPVEGFNPERIRSLKAGMETTLGRRILAAAVLDKDYRCDGECESISDVCKSFCNFITIHKCKEIENFLLVPSAIDRASAQRVMDKARRVGIKMDYSTNVFTLLENFAATKKSYIVAQYLADRRRFERTRSPTTHEAVINEDTLNEFERCWSNPRTRFEILPGKEALTFINQYLQDKYGVSVTPTAIIDSMIVSEISVEMKNLIAGISEFSSTKIN
ncbi:MAG: AAA family ATPase [Alphaproteobacteria bacterium]